jgi:adenylate cyclase
MTGDGREELRVIRQIAGAMNASLDLEEILQTILRAMDEELGFRHSMILLLNPAEAALTVAASRGYPSGGLGANVPVGQGVIGTVAKRRRIVRMGNIRSQLAYSAAVGQQMAASGGPEQAPRAAPLPGLPDVDSQIGIPLVCREQLIGVLSVESNRPSAFDEVDEMLLLILANQAASAIENARLYREERQRVEELNRADASLRELNESLEAKVTARTAELAAALEAVSEERQRSMDLLHRMAPAPVIPLMLEGKLVARRYAATTLFTDLAGFTQYSSNMEPDEIFSHLNHLFSQIGEQIESFRGYVSKTNGDSIMALFGAPVETQTHALDAVLAGLRMQAGLDPNLGLQMRIGINSGTITAGMLGPGSRQLYDVLGDTVNVASRLEKICPGGEVTVSESTLRLVEPYFAVEPMGEQEVKGKGRMQAYRVLGLLPLLNDTRRVDSTSLFARAHTASVAEVERVKEELQAVDFPSIQARDGALQHNEAVAAFALAIARYLRSRPKALPPAYMEQVNRIRDEEIVLLALLHDLGKYALDPALLNTPALPVDRRAALVAEMRRETEAALEQLSLRELIPRLEPFYRFEESRGAWTDPDPFTVLVAVADTYDALTAPKVYKGRPWTVQGSLEELLRMPYTQARNCPMVRNFVEFMQPEGKQIKAVVRTDRLFR